MKRSGPQSSSYFKYAPSHLHSFLFHAGGGGVYKEGGVSVLWRGLQGTRNSKYNMCGRHKVDHRGVQKRKDGVICANKIVD